ncbi:MAG: hypothetical protein U0521_13400 [Anaerolineae bacterium]
MIRHAGGWRDVHGLPHADNSFGAYLSFGVLEHFGAHMAKPSPKPSALDHGGILVLTIPIPTWSTASWRGGAGVRVSVLNDDEFFESTYTKRPAGDERPKCPV